MSQCKVVVAQLDDPAIFPQQYGVHFPPNFVDVVKVIFKRLFRVYAHIYHSHFKNVCSLGEEAHLNTCFKHFMAFAQVRLFRVGGRRLQRQLCRHEFFRVNTRAHWQFPFSRISGTYRRRTSTCAGVRADRAARASAAATADRSDGEVGVSREERGTAGPLRVRFPQRGTAK